MLLTEQQLNYLDKLCQASSLEALVELKKGNIKGIKNFNEKLINPDSISEHKEMKEIIKKHINIKNRANNKKRI